MWYNNYGNKVEIQYEKGEIIEKSYENNINLNLIYEFLDKFYYQNQDNYPEDVQKKIKDLIDTLGNYIYPLKNGYDMIEEKHYVTITYRKC